MKTDRRSLKYFVLFYRFVKSNNCAAKEEHEVEEDVAECSTEVEENCKDETSGYTTSTKCTKFPRNICQIVKKTVKKYTPLTGCNKEPRELCAPAGCGFVKVGTS